MKILALRLISFQKKEKMESLFFLFLNPFEFNQWVFLSNAVQQCQILCSKQIVICRQILCCKGMDTLMHFMLTGLLLHTMFNLLVSETSSRVFTLILVFCYHLVSSFTSLVMDTKSCSNHGVAMMASHNPVVYTSTTNQAAYYGQTFQAPPI